MDELVADKNLRIVHVCKSLQMDGASFELESIVEHTGEDDSGHYVTWQYVASTDTFILYDDGSVSKEQRLNESVLTGCYIAVYKRVSCENRRYVK